MILVGQTGRELCLGLGLSSRAGREGEPPRGARPLPCSHPQPTQPFNVLSPSLPMPAPITISSPSFQQSPSYDEGGTLSHSLSHLSGGGMRSPTSPRPSFLPSFSQSNSCARTPSYCLNKTPTDRHVWCRSCRVPSATASCCDGRVCVSTCRRGGWPSVILHVPPSPRSWTTFPSAATVVVRVPPVAFYAPSPDSRPSTEDNHPASAVAGRAGRDALASALVVRQGRPTRRVRPPAPPQDLQPRRVDGAACARTRSERSPASVRRGRSGRRRRKDRRHSACAAGRVWTGTADSSG